MVLTVVFGALAILLARLLPASAVLPALSSLLVVTSLAIAGAAWIFSARSAADAVSYWDVAAGLMLIGVSAALLGGSELILLEGYADIVQP